MKRIVIYIIVLALALLIPEQGNDVGRLQPVEVIFLRQAGDTVMLETDTGDVGYGGTVAEAFANLEETTAGIIFLDTADYLLLTEESEHLLEQIRNYVKTSVQLCYARAGIDLAEAAQFLDVHPPEIRLKKYNTGDKLPELDFRKSAGKFILKICN